MRRSKFARRQGRPPSWRFVQIYQAVDFVTSPIIIVHGPAAGSPPGRALGNLPNLPGSSANRKLSLKCRSAVRAPGLLCAEAGTRAAAPFPAPLSPLAASLLRYAPDRFPLTKPNTSCTIEVPASLRSDGVRVHPGMPFGIIPESAFGFAGILNHGDPQVFRLRSEGLDGDGSGRGT